MDESKTTRVVFVILLVLVAIWIGIRLFIAGMPLWFSEKDPIAGRAKIGDTEYLLTCETPVDFPTTLYLRRCSAPSQEACITVETYSDPDLDCSDVVLQEQTGVLLVELRSENKVLISYDPAH